MRSAELAAWVVVSVVLWTAPAAAQTSRAGQNESLPPTKLLSQMHHDVWQSRDGLPQNSVESIGQTSDGYLWIGTRQGLARFDGVQFVSFDRTALPDLGHILVSRLLVTSDGSLWIGTVGGGLSRLRDGDVQTFTMQDGLPGDAILALCEDREQRLWVATSGGLVRYDGHSVHAARRRDVWRGAGRLPAPELVGALWAGTQQHGCSAWIRLA